MKPAWSLKEMNADIEKYQREHYELTTDSNDEDRKLSPMQERAAANLYGKIEGMIEAREILENS